MKLYTIEAPDTVTLPGGSLLCTFNEACGGPPIWIHPYEPCGESGPFFDGLICTKPAGHAGRHGFKRHGNEYEWPSHDK